MDAQTKRQQLLKKHLKEPLDNVVSINDLREKEFNGDALTSEEHKALRVFDLYRISVLNKQKSEEDFHKKYMELQALSNLSPFQEFLKEKYQGEV